jgi:hypothetical protein
MLPITDSQRVALSINAETSAKSSENRQNRKFVPALALRVLT